MAAANAVTCGLDSVERAGYSQTIGVVDAFRDYMNGEPDL